jgi:hypothetical protein
MAGDCLRRQTSTATRRRHFGEDLERHRLKWIEAARKRLHHNVLAIALADKLARIALAMNCCERRSESH